MKFRVNARYKVRKSNACKANNHRKKKSKMKWFVDIFTENNDVNSRVNGKDISDLSNVNNIFNSN